MITIDSTQSDKRLSDKQANRVGFRENENSPSKVALIPLDMILGSLWKDGNG